MRPILEQCLSQLHLLLPADVVVDIEVPANRYFGGNIFMGDLLIVQDFIDHVINSLKKVRHKPDLIVIPSSAFSLGAWQRDLTGRPYLDIERDVGIPVELIDRSTVLE